MTDTQIHALIALTVMACVLVAMGYWAGRRDGYKRGIVDGDDTAALFRSVTIAQLRVDLDRSRADCSKERVIANWALAKSAMGETERALLVDIADHLDLCSRTFKALSSKPQAERSVALRARALSLADLLRPKEKALAA
jgi:hypothetical protein